MVKKLLLIISLLFLLIGCKTTNINDGEHIKEFSESVGKLEVLVDNMEFNSNQNKEYLESALNKANSLNSEIDKLDLLFTTYENLVNSMIVEKDKEIESFKTTLKEIKNNEK